MVPRAVGLASLVVSASVASQSSAQWFFARSAWNLAVSNPRVITTFDEPTWPVNTRITTPWRGGEAVYRGLDGEPTPNIFVFRSGLGALQGQVLCAVGREDIEIELDQRTRAFSIDVLVGTYDGAALLQAFDDAGRLVGATTVPPATSTTVGFVAGGSVKRLRYTAPFAPLEDFYIDNVTVAKDPCAADFNNDGIINDADFQLFIAPYDRLDCNHPGMGSGCYADLNLDWQVDDADFVLFVQAYNEIYCGVLTRSGTEPR